MNILKKYDDIIISRLMGIGDTIMLTPLLQGIKRLSPNTRITMVTEYHTLPLTKRMPFIDKALAFDKNLHDEWYFIKNLWRKDLVYCVDTSYRISLIYALAMIKERIGFPHKRGMYLTKYLQYEPWMDEAYEPYVHATLFKQATGIDVTQLDNWDKFYYPEANSTEKDNMDKLMLTEGICKHDYIVCSLESDTWQKDWPINSWLGLFYKLKEINKKIVILGIKSQRLNDIEFPDNVIDFRGKTNLVEMGYIVKNASLLIAVSSLFVHVANAFNIPIIGLYGPPPVVRDAPPENTFAIIKTTAECAPCDLLIGPSRGHCDAPFCMDSITVDNVFKEVERFFKG